MAELDSLDLSEQIHDASQACLARATQSDQALLAATQLLEIEALLAEVNWSPGTAGLDRDTTAQLRQAINQLRRNPDPIVARLGVRLAATAWRWLA